MSILDSLRPPPDLRVLVTCGAGGIGAVIARAFHEAGSRVHVCDIDRAALDRLNTEVPGITGSMADASVADDVDLVFDDVQGTLGGLDVLINNAGIRGPAGPIDTIGGAAWERTVAVNLHSHYYYARRAVPMLRRSGTSPRLIAMGSVAGPHDGAHRAACASTRWALVGLVKALARELGTDGIRVNAILPGAIDGSSRLASSASGDDRTPKASALRERSHRRSMTADDVAGLALFLCSPAARHLTGQAIGVDAGIDCH
jgi:NAD(P)-dependent dehydrogenase (short-subunit alcohol dehydrogenase family)